ncbi:uncharacterized protein LOC112468811 [Temnothorax curvispinosus]|uniref:Uncharacterized protein LOC112468811 n=1 Tax=Temnothorax curvispinosus TaxID=300111 RepID=A0A6J1RG26_9HYME|nr:uncharacterized protein LOC112468811 [Temnothorax curvispinosus]
MQRVIPECYRCKKSIANALVECECKKQFHPGCVKPYSVTKYADHCCKALVKHYDTPLTPQAENNFNLDIMTTPVSTGAQAQSQLQSQGDINSHDLLLRISQQLTEQMKVSNSRFSAFAEETNSRFNAFVEEQRRTNNELNDKLDRLNSIASGVERNSQRIVELEQQCSALADEIRNLKSNRAGSHSATRAQSENELIISGVPTAMSVTPLECVRNVFATLEIPELSCHVLNVRAVARKPLPPVAGDRLLPTSTTSSYIVTLASGAVRDTVMSKKRARRVLTQREVCGGSSDRNVHVNELLPKDTYELLQHTKRVAKDKSYQYVWVRGGRIHVRHSDGEPAIKIDSAADIDKLV